MDINNLNLIISVARLLDVRPEVLASAFNDKKENQAYYDLLLKAQQRLTLPNDG